MDSIESIVTSLYNWLMDLFPSERRKIEQNHSPWLREKSEEKNCLRSVDLKGLKPGFGKRSLLELDRGEATASLVLAFMMSDFLLTGPRLSRAVIGWDCCCLRAQAA